MAVTASLSEAEARFDAIRQKVGLIAAPVAFALLLWIPMPSLSAEAHRLAAVTAAIVILWVTEAIPLAASALLGPALAVIMDVTDADTAFAPFADPLMFLFLGGFMLAGALARHGFDRRSALWLISRPIVGGSPTRALIAISAISFVFSMWISNTATTAMLIPVALGLFATIKEVAPKDDETLRQLERYGGGMCLTMAYASSLGGAATPVGTGTNVIALGMLEKNAGVSIDFAQWMSFALPISLVITIAIVWMATRRFKPPVTKVEGLTEEVQRQLEVLGPLKPSEARAVGVFGLAVVGWLAPSFFRIFLGADHPISQWSKGSLDEGVVALTCAIILFFVPTGAPAEKGSPRRPRVLDWSIARELDWGAWFLLGGGLAMGKLTFTTGLADAIGHGLLDLAGPIASHPLGLTAAAGLLMIFMTEITSNTATTSMMLPVIIGIAQASGMDPTQTAVTVTLAASCAFMLPVSTPPNAMAYGSGMIRIDTMISFGFRLDLLAYVILMVMAAVLLPVML